VTFARLRPADWVVFVAALALLFTTAPDWYSNQAGETAREVEQQARPDEDQPSGQVQSEVEEDAGAFAESKERNAWQEDGLLDRIILICLLATAALGVAAAFWRAGGRESDGVGPFGIAGLAACVTALLVLYRILQEPGFDEITVVKIGAPLALGVLGVMAFACAIALREGPTYNRER
jgi:drug/metabolite transporter (DMT)-like permease